MTGARVIAIDGPAGAGKSSTARALAEHLGFFYLDTGAMYRALALAAGRAGIPLEDEPGVLRKLGELDLRFDSAGRLYLDGEDVTPLIRDGGAASAASRIAQLPGVRARLVDKQREMAQQHGSVVMEGRDIGTVVCPDTPVKLFLEADLTERARRRIRQNSLVPSPEELERVTRAIQARDEADQTRAEAPLRAAEDAVRIDTTGLSFDAQVARCLEAIRGRWPGSWGNLPEGAGA